MVVLGSAKGGDSAVTRLAKVAPLAALLAVAACGTGGGGGGTVSPAVSPTPAPCTVAAAAATGPAGRTQALRLIQVMVTAGAATTPGVLQLGPVSCVSVGVGQRVTVAIDARIPPVPAEPAGSRVLSTIAVSPPAGMGAGMPGHYTIAFTAEAAGATTLAYLPATCTLPPGAC